MYANQFRVFTGVDRAGAKMYWQGSFFSHAPFNKGEKVIITPINGTPEAIGEVHQSSHSQKKPYEYSYFGRRLDN